jgi:hypothetical protein
MLERKELLEKEVYSFWQKHVSDNKLHHATPDQFIRIWRSIEALFQYIDDPGDYDEGINNMVVQPIPTIIR